VREVRHQAQPVVSLREAGRAGSAAGAARPPAGTQKGQPAGGRTAGQSRPTAGGDRVEVLDVTSPETPSRLANNVVNIGGTNYGVPHIVWSNTLNVLFARYGGQSPAQTQRGPSAGLRAQDRRPNPAAR